MTNRFKVENYPNIEKASQALAQKITEMACSSVAQNGRFSLVLSGGKTPRRLYELIGTKFSHQIPWANVHLFWGDERWISHDSEESNFYLASSTFLKRVSIPKGNIHPIPVQELTPRTAAEKYEKTLRLFFQDSKKKTAGFFFDVVLLGLGHDGHTASLFPGSQALYEKSKWVVPVEAPDSFSVRKRLTLTYPLINHSRSVFFLVSGEQKRRLVNTMHLYRRSPSSVYPAEMVSPKGELVFYCG